MWWPRQPGCSARWTSRLRCRVTYFNEERGPVDPGWLPHRCQRRPRGEREVQVAEPTQDVGRLEGVTPLVGRAMLSLTDRDVGHPVQDALKRDAAFDAGERRTRAGVHTAGERHVFADILAVELKFVRVLEPAWVTIGGAGQNHNDGADGDLDPADGGRPQGEPGVALDRALRPQRFLDEARDQTAVLAQLLLNFGP